MAVVSAAADDVHRCPPASRLVAEVEAIRRHGWMLVAPHDHRAADAYRSPNRWSARHSDVVKAGVQTPVEVKPRRRVFDVLTPYDVVTEALRVADPLQRREASGS